MPLWPSRGGGAEWRQRDFDFVTSERFRALLRDLGFTLVTWRQIGALGSPSGGR